MLFLFGDAPKIEGEDEKLKIEKGATLLTQAQKYLKAVNETIAINLESAYETLTKSMLAMEDSTMALKRSMGGFVDQSGELQRSLEQAYLENLKFGATFKDAAETAQGMATQMGRMVNPSADVLSNALAFSKASGMANAETGKMIVDFQTFGGDQKQAISKMSELGQSARKSGLDAKSFTTEVAKNLKQASLFGFKGGVKDIEEMVKKTKLLGTSMEKLQIKGAAEKLLDPETAMQTAASLQMIGGNIGALGNPFQLLHMGQKDMKKLTDEVLNMAKATFTFDKETGAFAQTTEDMYALRAQAEALGISYEETANAGKELAKVDYIKSVANLESLTADQQNLIGGLSQIDKDGKVTVDLPGFEEGNRDLATLMKDQNFTDALNEYEKNAAKSDKEMAIEQMSISEKQLATENEIKNLLLFNMAPGKREKFIQEQKEMNEDLAKKALEIADPLAKGSSELITTFNTAAKEGADATVKTFDEMAKKTDLKAGANKVTEAMKKTMGLDFLDKKTNNEGLPTVEGDQQTPVIETKPLPNVAGDKTLPTVAGDSTPQPTPVPDGLFSAGSPPMIMSKGKIYEGLKEDSVYVGTDFEKIFERGKAATNVLSEMMAKGGVGGSNTEVSGKVDFGEIRVKIDAPGVDTSMLDKALNSRQFTNQIMSMVANQKSFYTNQATLQG